MGTFIKNFFITSIGLCNEGFFLSCFLGVLFRGDSAFESYNILILNGGSNIIVKLNVHVIKILLLCLHLCVKFQLSSTERNL